MRKLLVWTIAAPVLVGVLVAWLSFLQTPKYEASAAVLPGEQSKSDGRPHPIPTTWVSFEEVTRAAVSIDSRPVAKETVRRLGSGARITPDELLDNLTTERDKGTMLI